MHRLGHSFNGRPRCKIAKFLPPGDIIHYLEAAVGWTSWQNSSDLFHSLSACSGIRPCSLWVRGEGRANDREILSMKNELKVFAKVAIEEWSGRCILGQRCKILLNAFHNDPSSPECSAIILEWWADFAFDICLLQRCICLVNVDLFSAVGFLRQTHSRYLRYRLEAKMAEVMHGLGSFIEIFLETGGARRLMRVCRTLDHKRCCQRGYRP